MIEVTAEQGIALLACGKHVEVLDTLGCWFIALELDDVFRAVKVRTYDFYDVRACMAATA